MIEPQYRHKELILIYESASTVSGVVSIWGIRV